MPDVICSAEMLYQLTEKNGLVRQKIRDLHRETMSYTTTYRNVSRKTRQTPFPTGKRATSISLGKTRREEAPLRVFLFVRATSSRTRPRPGDSNRGAIRRLLEEAPSANRRIAP